MRSPAAKPYGSLEQDALEKLWYDLYFLPELEIRKGPDSHWNPGLWFLPSAAYESRQLMVLLAVPDGVLSRPSVSYAVIEKYQVPRSRYSIR